jgi:acid phosphatase (class A)
MVVLILKKTLSLVLLGMLIHAPLQANVSTTGVPAKSEATSLPPLPPPVFITPADLRLAERLAAYPLKDSLADLADLDVVLNLQRTRTPADVAAASKHAMLAAEPWLKDVLGDKYVEGRFVKTIQLFNQIQADLRGVNRAANAVHPYRLRPAERDVRVKPSLPPGRVQTSSFPSANATTLFVWRNVLTTLMPSQTEVIANAVEQGAWLRVVSGLHYPSDVAGSRQVADAAYSALTKSPAYTAALSAAQIEFK